VYRYVGGRRDWFAAGLPMQGTRARRLLAGAVARPDVPTCRLADMPSDVRARLRTSGSAVCIVVDEAGVVLGRLGRPAWRSKSSAASVEDVMDVPTTYRPDNLVESLLERGGAGAEIVITTSDGVLVGVVSRRDARRTLDEFRRTRNRKAPARPGRRASARSRTRATARTRP
jgi:CBS domain-containing protein